MAPVLKNGRLQHKKPCKFSMSNDRKSKAMKCYINKYKSNKQNKLRLNKIDKQCNWFIKPRINTHKRSY